jgi:hypothetical protein
VGGDVVVHLGPPLLAVVNDVQAGFLQQLKGIERRPVVQLRAAEGLNAPTQHQHPVPFLDLIEINKPTRLRLIE